jgi:hypothetical protein
MAGREQRIRGRRWRLLVGTAAFGVAALGLSSAGFPTTTAAADEAPSHTAVVECTSGTITNGDVHTSSLFVARVPADVHPDLPGGCVVRTG